MINLNELMVVDGEYDKNLGWVKNIHRVGVLNIIKRVEAIL